MPELKMIAYLEPFVGICQIVGHEGGVSKGLNEEGFLHEAVANYLFEVLHVKLTRQNRHFLCDI